MTHKLFERDLTTIILLLYFFILLKKLIFTLNINLFLVAYNLVYAFHFLYFFILCKRQPFLSDKKVKSFLTAAVMNIVFICVN